ncbi:hypothetical protein CKO43_04565 [Rubrivivax gelatinosus]|uniref:Uncharacterized protein n=1 Tax=Rubrivivax gelatinosus TaxID=28068 RepID=A0ABS1DR12_RUBGE|nr:hypothetical protein [Rubrivivax gelatinosus]
MSLPTDAAPGRAVRTQPAVATGKCIDTGVARPETSTALFAAVYGPAGISLFMRGWMLREGDERHGSYCSFHARGDNRLQPPLHEARCAGSACTSLCIPLLVHFLGARPERPCAVRTRPTIAAGEA